MVGTDHLSSPENGKTMLLFRHAGAAGAMDDPAAADGNAIESTKNSAEMVGHPTVSALFSLFCIFYIGEHRIHIVVLLLQKCAGAFPI